MTTTTTPLLLTLPAELRIQIYRDLMLDDLNAKSSRIQIDPTLLTGPTTEHQNECQRSAQLLLTCKLIYQEALPVLYSENILFFKYVGRYDFLQTIGETGRALIRHIEMACFLPLKDVRCIDASTVVLESPVVDLGRERLPNVESVKLELVRYLSHKEDALDVCRRLVREMTGAVIGKGHFAFKAAALIDDCRWEVHFRTASTAMIQIPSKVGYCTPTCYHAYSVCVD
jgi:hypothetical protein